MFCLRGIDSTCFLALNVFLDSESEGSTDDELSTGMILAEWCSGSRFLRLRVELVYQAELMKIVNLEYHTYSNKYQELYGDCGGVLCCPHNIPQLDP